MSYPWTSGEEITSAKLKQTGIAYAEDAGSTDAYAVSFTPAPSAYTDGMTVAFKANTVNTDAATLNVNSLGAKTIKKHNDRDLATGDIEAEQIVVVVYNSTDGVFEMVSPVANKREFGAWAGKSENTVYQAASDGFVVGHWNVEAGFTDGQVKSDGSNPPTTVRVQGDAGSAGEKVPFCVPIRSGDYYKVERNGSGGSAAVYWLPISG